MPTEEKTETKTEEKTVEKTEDKGELGEGGKKALDDERRARKEAEREAKAAKDELDKLRAATMSDSEKAIAEAKAEGRKEALSEANARLVRAEIKSAAAGKLADPQDAAHFLGDLNRFVDDKGDIREKDITTAIDELVKSKPYLSRKSGSADGGQRGNGTEPSDMNDLIRQRMGRS